MVTDNKQKANKLSENILNYFAAFRLLKQDLIPGLLLIIGGQTMN